MHDELRYALLGGWARLVTRRPWTVLIVTVLLAVGAIVLTALRLDFQGDRSDLVDPDLEWNRRYAEYRAVFERWDDLIICLEGDPDDPRIDAFARTFADHLRSFDRVSAADAGFSTDEVGPRLFRAAPPDVFDTALAELTVGRRIALAANANTALTAMLVDARDRGATGADTLDALDPILTPFLAALRGDTPSFSAWTPDEEWIPLRDQRRSARLRTVLVHCVAPDRGIDTVSTNLTWLREQLAAQVAAADLPPIEWGVTGIPAIEADETAQSIQDSTRASILALVLVTALMLVVFRSVRVPLLATLALIVGIAWSFGWVVIAVGHLQLLSVVFTVILLGLGIDFALHMIARLELVRDEHASLSEAIVRVYRGIGPGLLTGAITTAAAFGATALTNFKGVAEMGIIASGGILLCMIAMLTVFPAALAVSGRWKRVIRSRPGGEDAPFRGGGPLRFPETHPATTLTTCFIVVGVLALLGSRVTYDPNILNLHPPGIESVQWEQRIVEESSANVWSALVETNPADAPAMVDALRALPEANGVGGMGLLFPPDRAERDARIATAAAIPPPTPVGATLPMLVRILGDIRDRVGTEAPTLRTRLDTAIATAGELDPATASARMNALNEAFAAFQTELAPQIETALSPGAPGAEDLPPALAAQWTVGDRWLLRVQPAEDPRGRSILDPERLGPFVNAVLSVAPDAHGPPVQIFESTKLIKKEYAKAACYAVAAILVILLIDFRSLADAIAAMVPVSIGFVGIFGGMTLLGIPLNFANIIVLPLIFGIGVDAGVHIVHRWRDSPAGRPAGLSGGTGRGVTVTMLTTMIGFGCMTIAEHRGIRSLGVVMVLGLFVTLMACYLILPAILRLRSREAPTTAE